MEGREEVEDDERPGRPSTSKIEENFEKISEIIRKDRRLSVRMISKIVNIVKETVSQSFVNN
jgi:predicted DNA binding CopG/RHH family protein